MAGRISLVEEYENKDMIVQVKKCLDQTEAAVEASETARDVSIASAAEAHEASTNANSASAQAQTAAQTVATYGARLQAAEDGVVGNRSSIQTIDGEITDIYNDLTNVLRKVGDPGQIVYNGLELRGTNRTSDTLVGQLNDFIVNAKRLIQEIDSKLNSYAPMLRTTGNQKVTNYKDFLWTVRQQNDSVTGDTPPSSYISGEGFRIIGSDEGAIVSVGFEKSVSDIERIVLRCFGNDHDGIKTQMQIHYIFDEVAHNIRMQPAIVKKDGSRVFGNATTLMTWTED